MLIIYTIQISLSIKAVPEIIFSAALPTIPNVSFIRIFSLVADENKQNYYTLGYIGGGFAKKSMYITGNA